MPGRGRPWRGVGQGNQDRIGTGAIADGSITEADLDSALQAKVNAGGGTWELLDNEKLTSAVNTVTLSFTSEDLTDPDASKYVFIGSCQTVAGEELRWRVNGNSTDGYDTNSIQLDKSTYTKSVDLDDGAWLTGRTANTPNSFHFELTLSPVSDIGGSTSLLGHLKEIIIDSGAGLVHTDAVIRYTNATNSLSSFTCLTEAGENFRVDSTFAVYKVKNS